MTTRQVGAIHVVCAACLHAKQLHCNTGACKPCGVPQFELAAAAITCSVLVHATALPLAIYSDA
jgi:hypothetical protein